LALGQLPAAEASYVEALNTLPDYYRALAGLAQVRAAQQRYPEALDLYRKAIAIVPLPEYAAALGDVYTKLGRPEEAQKPYDLVEYIGYLNTLSKVLYNRELAYFYADHDRKLPEALELAKRELEVRQDIYAYDVLAWALYKNGRPQEALAPMTEALKLGTKDARLFFHAGMIRHRLGEHEQAREYLRRALATNPYFHILHAEVAERTLQAVEGELSMSVLQEQTDDR
jgi:tetratricopeptide (TPR) repeat protein